MTRERASIFASDDAFDVSAFAPKAAHELNGASAELVRGDRVGFTIREPRGEGELAGERCPLAGRPPRIYRTGRTMQFNARAKPQTVEALYDRRSAGMALSARRSSTPSPPCSVSWQGRAQLKPNCGSIAVRPSTA